METIKSKYDGLHKTVYGTDNRTGLNTELMKKVSWQALWSIIVTFIAILSGIFGYFYSSLETLDNRKAENMNVQKIKIVQERMCIDIAVIKEGIGHIIASNKETKASIKELMEKRKEN